MVRLGLARLGRVRSVRVGFGQALAWSGEIWCDVNLTRHATAGLAEARYWCGEAWRAHSRARRVLRPLQVGYSRRRRPTDQRVGIVRTLRVLVCEGFSVIVSVRGMQDRAPADLRDVHFPRCDSANGESLMVLHAALHPVFLVRIGTERGASPFCEGSTIPGSLDSPGIFGWARAAPFSCSTSFSMPRS